MSIDRREFIKSTAALAAAGTLASRAAFADQGRGAGWKAVQEGPMAYNPATWYRPYASQLAHQSNAPMWLQIDLGAPNLIDGLRLYPAFRPGDLHASSFGFPLRFRIEASGAPSFSSPTLLVDQTAEDFADPNDAITTFHAPAPVNARYVRLTATRLRNGQDGVGYQLALAKFEVLSAGVDVAEHRPATGDPTYANPNDFAQLTRAPRPMGEGIVTDNPSNVIPAAQWRQVPFAVTIPVSGVTPQGEIFHRAMENNINYLLGSFSVDEMLRPFRERAGKPVDEGLRKPIPFWDTTLPGSSAGRFLMGAGNTLRWIDHPELRASMNAVVDGIEECRVPNGYIMAYPEELILKSERGGYTRSWVTHGLIEAGYAGNPKAFPLLRGFYDWFDNCAHLSKLMRGGTQGVQGMIANTRMYFTPVGKPEDIQVIQRYYQENYWLDGLAKRDTDIVWQYPYDRPHNYLITDFEAYLDIYRATGDEKYLRAMEGAWQLYHDNWEHVGGSIAITEFGQFPPKSYRIEAQFPFCETGETCGSSFWVKFNQRFLAMHPEEEKYAAEIEKSIYNVALANQIADKGIIYHTRLAGMKGDLHVPLCTNSCCEGQGTRLIASMPEYIFSTASDGLYVNLFEPASIQWSQSGAKMEVSMSGNFPYKPDITLTITASHPAQAKIRVRIPSWAASQVELRVNEQTAATGRPGTYVTLDRTWSTGDTIRFTLPMKFKLTRYEGLDQIEGHHRYALEYGPILMALIGSDSAMLKAADAAPEAILDRLQQDSFRPLHFNIDGYAQFKYVPYWQVVSEPFTCFPVIDHA
ncbi:MAG TPA: beta-L-arabinofuranosidase domain-containing protein [Terracidiphilus sp.]|nr:beta-L-arabinofuranosidase domain-containing protein [Terracidiphilus sp.]